ncbi:MAG: hypothetical protein ABI220_02015 [Candidatus Saccharimonadales bacterium]
MKQKRTILVIAVLVIVVLAGGIGWQLGHSGKTSAPSPAISPAITGNESSSTGSKNVNKLASYSLPDGWKQSTCQNATGEIFIDPDGTSADCNTNPVTPIKLYIDPQNTTDCQQLNGITNVRKHTCKSLYIGGQKSLQALTEYPASASYPVNTTISDYYVNTGKGIVVVEYQYTASSQYQAGFDQLAMSLHGK